MYVFFLLRLVRLVVFYGKCIFLYTIHGCYERFVFFCLFGGVWPEKALFGGLLNTTRGGFWKGPPWSFWLTQRWLFQTFRFFKCHVFILCQGIHHHGQSLFGRIWIEYVSLFPTTLSKSKWLEVELMMNVYLILMFPLGPKMVLGEVLPNGKHANSKQTWMEYEPWIMQPTLFLQRVHLRRHFGPKKDCFEVIKCFSC